MKPQAVLNNANFRGENARSFKTKTKNNTTTTTIIIPNFGIGDLKPFLPFNPIKRHLSINHTPSFPS